MHASTHVVPFGDTTSVALSITGSLLLDLLSSLNFGKDSCDHIKDKKHCQSSAQLNIE